MTHGYVSDKEALIKRLHRIEGQVRGVERMIEEERYCIDVLTQISAVQTALESLSVKLLEDHVRHCVADALAAGRLVRPFATELDDGLGYFLVTTEAGIEKSTVQAFIRWLRGRLALIAEGDAIAVDGGG